MVGKKSVIIILVFLILISGISIFLIFQKSALHEKCDGGICDDLEISLIKKINIQNGARPEISVMQDRVFVVYLDDSSPTYRAHKVKIFDKDMNKEIETKTLVSTHPLYGNPTDIRITSDGEYLYAFYETANHETDKAYLWGAKYVLDDNFEKVSYTSEPITVDRLFYNTQNGDELVNDPAPVIGPNSIFVFTRIVTPLFKGGKTILRGREFSYDLQTKISEFDLDLSNVVDGKARQVSLIYHYGFFYLAIPTTVGDITINVDLAVPSDIVMVKFDENWEIIEHKIISSESDDTETYVTGFKTDGNYFYLTYSQIIHIPEMFSKSNSPLKIYDMNFNLIHTEIVKSTIPEPGKVGMRPSIEITEDRIYLGNNRNNTAEIFIYEKK